MDADCADETPHPRATWDEADALSIMAGWEGVPFDRDEALRSGLPLYELALLVCADRQVHRHPLPLLGNLDAFLAAVSGRGPITFLHLNGRRP